MYDEYVDGVFRQPEVLAVPEFLLLCEQYSHFKSEGDKATVHKEAVVSFLIWHGYS